MKKCPYCAEEIQDDAIVCRYCGRDLPKKSLLEDKEKPSKSMNWPWRKGAIIAGVFTAISAIGLIFQNQYDSVEYFGYLFFRIIAGFLFWWLLITGLIVLWQKTWGKIIMIIVFLLSFVIFGLGYLGTLPISSSMSLPTQILSPTQVSNGCPDGINPVSWDEIGFEDRDKKLCIYGKVYKLEDNDNGGKLITFSATPKNFYVFINGSLKPFIVEGSCIVVSGTVSTNIDGTPYLLVTGNSINSCPQ